MKSIKDVLAVIVGLAAGAGSIYYFYKFVTFVEAEGGHSYLWKALGLAVIAFVCGLVYFLDTSTKKKKFTLLNNGIPEFLFPSPSRIRLSHEWVSDFC